MEPSIDRLVTCEIHIYPESVCCDVLLPAEFIDICSSFFRVYDRITHVLTSFFLLSHNPIYLLLNYKSLDKTYLLHYDI